MKPSRVIFAIFVMIGACPYVLAGVQTAERPTAVQRIDVNDRRPLRAALKIFEERYGLAITYEDPVYSCSSDPWTSRIKSFFTLTRLHEGPLMPRAAPSISYRSPRTANLSRTP
jgi:hypothetical protein